MTIHVATAGWGIPKQFQGTVVSEGTGLQKYSQRLSAVEINSTFYKRHRPATFERWRDSVPDAFRFAVKLPQTISHEAALLDCEQELEDFLADVSGLGGKLGPILVQLPGSQALEPAVASQFFARLRGMHAGPVACEPRHASWYGPAAEQIFLEQRIARVVADPPRPDAARFPGGDSSLRYVRWHGSPRVYWSEYSEERLLTLQQLLEPDVDRSEVWCVFDNTASGAAFGDALRFAQMTSSEHGAGTADRLTSSHATQSRLQDDDSSPHSGPDGGDAASTQRRSAVDRQ